MKNRIIFQVSYSIALYLFIPFVWLTYNSRKGNFTENENLLKGKLEATERHLNDLRTYLDKQMKVKR